MSKLNPFFSDVKREYIFPIIEKKLMSLKERSPSEEILNLGIGDVALPLIPTAANAIIQAIQEMSHPSTFQGYPPSHGYDFLREAIATTDYENLGINPSDIFISDGINSDASNLQELFTQEASVGICDPTYPVYLDVNLMAGRKNIHILPCTPENGFIPRPPAEKLDFVYLCTPGNPTATAIPKNILQEWVDYAHQNNTILIIDNAYSAFTRSPNVPKSIYEIPGARDVAIELRSFSKSSGFTALRISYSVVPSTLALHKLWKMRMATKSNGVSYPIQKAALATLSPQGQLESRTQVDHYLNETKTLLEGLKKLGYEVYGGIDAPYVFWKTPKNFTSWEFFDYLLEQCRIVSVPGTGFGKYGEGFVRLSGFIPENLAQKALTQIATLCL